MKLTNYSRPRDGALRDRGADEAASELKPVDLAALVEDCVALSRAQIERSGLLVMVHIDRDIPSAVRCHPLPLRRILLTLLGNAARFTTEGEIAVSLTRKGGTFSIAVDDSGVGIETDRIEAIFDFPSDRADCGNGTYRASSVGLPESRRLVKTLGGTLAARSETGRGSCFTLTFPLIPLAEIEYECRAHKRLEAQYYARATRVLLAEDHEVSRLVAMSMLDRCGLAFDIAHDGEEAIEKVLAALDAGRPYELLLMDLDMPECDGREAARVIRLAGIDAEMLPIVALTASAADADVRAALAAGMQAQLLKPLAFGELVSALNRWLPHRVLGTDGPLVQLPQGLHPCPSSEFLGAQKETAAR